MPTRFTLASALASFLGASVALAQAPAVEPTPPPRPASSPTGTISGPPQSLADVARQTKDKNKGGGLVITNETLKKKAPGTGSVSTISVGGKPTPAAGKRPTPPAAVVEQRDSLGRSETDWRTLAKGGRERLVRAEEERKRLESEVKRLENDFYAWSDGNYRDRVIRPAWDQAKEALRAALAEGDAARKAYSDLEEEARKAGTPPGWLR